jgi:hypothetical protein
MRSDLHIWLPLLILQGRHDTFSCFRIRSNHTRSSSPNPGIYQGICHFEDDRTALPDHIIFANSARTLPGLRFRADMMSWIRVPATTNYSRSGSGGTRIDRPRTERRP